MSSAKPMNALPGAGSQSAGALSPRCRCSSCRAGSGPVTPIHSVPRCRNHLPSWPSACGKLPQPLVPGFRFRRQIWEEQTKQCQDSLLRQLPGSHHSSFLPPFPVPSALLSQSCQQDFSLIRAGLSPSIGPDDRTLAAFQCFGLPGFLLPSRMALLGPQLLQPAAPPAFAASTGDL